MTATRFEPTTKFPTKFIILGVAIFEKRDLSYKFITVTLDF